MQRQLMKQIDLYSEEIPYLIGPKGETVTQIRTQSGAKVRFMKEGTREFAEIRGYPPYIDRAIKLIQEKLENYHPHLSNSHMTTQIQTQPMYVTTAYPYTAVMQLPQGASRYYQNPQGRVVFGELHNVIKMEKNQITLKAQTQQELDANKEKLTKILNNFACVAIPAPIWAVGRIIGRQGEGIQKIYQQVQQTTGSQCLVYFPEANQADGIFSYAIVTSDDFHATQACTEIIIARLAAITEYGGVICDMLPSSGFCLSEVAETDIYCQSYLQKIQIQYPNQKIKIINCALNGEYQQTAHYFNSNLPYYAKVDDIIDHFPTLFCPTLSATIYPQHYIPPCEQKPVELFLPLQINSLPSDFDVSKIILAKQEYDIFADFSLDAAQTTPVDRKFLVISARPDDLQNASFWRNLVKFTFQVLELQFFTSHQQKHEPLSDFCDVEFQAFPGKAVLMPKGDYKITTASQLSDALLKRDLTSRFIAGVPQTQFESFLKDSAVYYYWKAQLCQKSLLCGGNQIWHRIQIEKPVYLPARPTVEEDLQAIEDFPDLSVQVLKRAICVQIMIHLPNFVQSKQNDLLILLKTRPKSGQDQRLLDYIQQIQQLSSQDAFINTNQFDDEDKDDECTSKYGVASLRLPYFLQPDIFASNENRSITLNNQIPAAPIYGLLPPNACTRGQLIASQTLSLEQANATLIECRYRFRGNLAILHTDVVDFGALTERKKFVITLQPNCGGVWGNEGVKCTAYALDGPDFGTELKQFVWECINVCY